MEDPKVHDLFDVHESLGRQGLEHTQWEVELKNYEAEKQAETASLLKMVTREEVSRDDERRWVQQL